VKRLLALVTAIGSLALASSVSAQAAATSTTFTIDSVVTACSEPIKLEGTVHAVFATTNNPAGGFLLVSTTNPQGVTGTGLTSGLTYQGTGVTKVVLATAQGSTVTFVNNFRLISRTSSEDVIVQQVFHVTVNANGDTTASVDRASVLCR
jgi:hypothetical protein